MNEDLPEWFTRLEKAQQFALDLAEHTAAFQQQRMSLFLWLGDELCSHRELAEPRLIEYIFSFILTPLEAREMWLRIIRYHSMQDWKQAFVAWYAPDRQAVICCSRAVYSTYVTDYPTEIFEEQFPFKTRLKSGLILHELVPNSASSSGFFLPGDLSDDE